MAYLYDLFRRYPLAPVELRQIASDCGTDSTELNWNMVYLEKKGWIELDNSADCPPYVACTAGLTGSGIDRVESGDGFGRRVCPNDDRPCEPSQ